VETASGGRRRPGPGALAYNARAMESFVQGWGLTIVLCGFIVLVFLAGWWHVHRELAWVRGLTDFLGLALVNDDPDDPAGWRRPSSLEIQAIRDEAHAIVTARDPAWSQKQLRSWQMRAQRLEPTLAFWTDLLRQLGLLGTVLGLGLSLAYTGSDLTKLLGPLALKVWTTVAGLACSILLSASFSMRLTAWIDACDKNLESWDAGRRARRDRRADRSATGAELAAPPTGGEA
jgi:MotA/TolQ/ExbB proton channel family